MNAGNEAIFEQLNRVVEQILSGTLVSFDVPTPEPNASAQMQHLIENLRLLKEQYNASYAFVLDLSRGKLESPAPPKNNFATPFKQLQAELLHLIWQIQEIAVGDYNQKVSFSGDFSEAFNKLIETLKEKQRLDLLNQENERLFQTIFRASPDGIILADLSGKLLFISDAGKEILRIEDADLQQGIFLSTFLTIDETTHDAAWPSNLPQASPTRFDEQRIRRKDGSIFWGELNANMLYDAQDQARRVMIIFRDITQRKRDAEKLLQYADDLQQLNIQLAELSITDPLTGVYNRRQFDIEVRQEIQRAQRFGSVFSLVMLDIDRFRDFNNHYGHLAGDMVLVEVTRLIQAITRQVDLLFRYGGEEFMILLPETHLENALVITEKMQKGIKALALSYNGQKLPSITASFGVVCSSGQPLNAQHLVQAVDQALYHAKNNGRNRIQAAA